MSDEAQQFPEMMTVHEVAPRLRMSESGLRRLIRTGEVRASRIGGRWLISRAEVLRLLEKGSRPIVVAGGREIPRMPPEPEPDDDKPDAPPVEQAGPPRAHRSYSASAARMVAPRVIG